MEVIQIPPAYSEDDAKRRDCLLRRLKEIETRAREHAEHVLTEEDDAKRRDYLLRRLKEIETRAREHAEHVLTELALIENRYAPRYLVTGAETRATRPDSGTDTTDNGLQDT